MLEHGCIRVGFLEKQNRQDAYINREREREREMYFKELAYVIVEAHRGRREDWRLEEGVQSESSGCLLVDSPLALGRSVFVLIKTSTDRVRPTHHPP